MCKLFISNKISRSSLLAKRVHVMSIQPLGIPMGNNRIQLIKIFLQIINKPHSRRLDKVEQRETFPRTSKNATQFSKTAII